MNTINLVNGSPDELDLVVRTSGSGVEVVSRIKRDVGIAGGRRELDSAVRVEDRAEDVSGARDDD